MQQGEWCKPEVLQFECFALWRMLPGKSVLHLAFSKMENFSPVAQ